MCLSTVYKGNDISDENKLAEYVTNIVADEAGSVRIHVITGAAYDFKGVVRAVDLMQNIVFLDTRE
ncbi:MAG: CooT family nickel-binding protein [Clostridiales Family XIII bacterium]|nr:CooT family nickel-binding protein [Clostridiales Family XIII bacterium]